MRRVFLFVAVVALALLGTSDRAIADSDDITLSFGPALKYTGATGSFSVDILIDNYHVPICDPDCGLNGYELWVEFEPDVISYVDFDDGPFLESTGNTATCSTYPPGTVQPPVPDNRARLLCREFTPEFAGPRGSGTLAIITFAPVTTGASDLSFYVEAGHVDTELVTIHQGTQYTPQFETEPGSVVVITLGGGDTDGDGCTDVQEVGSDPALGGWRNPTDANDFYDVPYPTLADGGSTGNRDKVIDSAKDLTAVLQYLGTYAGGPANSEGVDYDDDGGLTYDRSDGVQWSGAPDGYISVIGDAMELLPQLGHDCR